MKRKAIARLTGSLLVCATLSAASAFMADPAVSGELSKTDIVKQLQSPAKTRSITATPQPELDADTRRMIETLRSAPTRQIVVEERKKLATALKETKLPSLDLHIPFEYDSAAISQHALPILVQLGEALTDPGLASASFVVGGHTDARGAGDYNLKLSQRRAEAVREFLNQTFGIDDRRLVAIGFGEVQLKNAATPEAAENRRVQLVNVGQ